MRVSGILIACVGCYQPASDPACAIACTPGAANACPSGLLCGALALCEEPGSPCSSILDAAPVADVGPLLPCVGFFDSVPQSIIGGQQYTPDDTRSRVALLALPKVYVGEGTVGSTEPMSYMDSIVLPSGNTFLSAALAPEGTRIYVTTDAGPQSELWRSDRLAAQSWTPPVRIGVFDADGVMMVPVPPAGRVLSITRAASGPRRLALGDASTTGFTELVERRPDEFDEGPRTTMQQLEVDLVAEPSLGPDGRRVIFAGRRAGSAYSFFIAERQTVNDPFGSATLLREVSTGDGAPNLSEDCQHLYWRSGSSIVYISVL